MSGDAAQNHDLMRMLRRAMEDPALSGGCFLLAELFSALAGEEEAQPLLKAIPGWKVPGLLLSAALLYRAAGQPGYPLSPWLAESAPAFDAAFRAAVRQVLREDGAELAQLAERHTYQCNPPRRMAVSLLAAATVAGEWTGAWHLDVGTASGIGLLLGEVRVTSGVGLGSETAALAYPIELRGAPLDLAALRAPGIERSIGIDLDPPDLRAADCRTWMRACQYPLAAELAYFDQAVDLLLARRPRVERGSATELLAVIAREMPPGRPLLVTDTYATLFMSEEDREKFRRDLDIIAQTRPVVWISNNTLVPPGPAPESTTAGTSIPLELLERNQREIFGTVCITTWPEGRRTPRIVGLTHPSGCWFEWRPDLAGSG